MVRALPYDRAAHRRDCCGVWGQAASGAWVCSNFTYSCAPINHMVSQVKLNTDESPGVATEYGIRSIPTVMVFKNGQKMDTVIGAVPKQTLVNTVEKYL